MDESGPLTSDEPDCLHATSPSIELRVLRPGSHVVLTTDRPTRALLVGGARLEGRRHIWWNFVSSSEARIERAKDDWKNGRFPVVAGDEREFIPLPER